MTSTPSSFWRVWTAAGLSLVLAGGVSTAALLGAAGPERQSWGLPVSPFGWQRVIVIHSLATLVLSWWMARTLGLVSRPRDPHTSERWSPSVAPRMLALVAVTVGLGAGWLSWMAGDAVELFLPHDHAGAASRFFCRVLWCVVLQVPWCLLGTVASGQAQSQRPALFSTMNLGMLAMLVAVGVPASFFAVFLGQQTEYARAAWQVGKLTQSRQLVQRLCDLGSTLSLGDRMEPGQPSVTVTPRRALADLQQLERFLERRVAQLTAAEPAHQQPLLLAQYLLALNHHSLAETVLCRLADHQPDAALSLAEMYKSQGQLRSSSHWASRAIRLAREFQPAGPEEEEAKNELQLRAYDILILAAGEQSDMATAERYLWEAFQHLPGRRAEIYDRLGKHYEFVGELSKAIECQGHAAQLDSAKYSRPESLLVKMLSTGAPVGLARPKSSRYR